MEAELIERKILPAAPGITYIAETFMDREDGIQQAHILKIEKGAPVKIHGAFPDDGKFGLQEVRRMAAAAVQQGETLIGAVNADFFNMTNGVPRGVFIRNGEILKGDMKKGHLFFGITRDEKYVIGDEEKFREEKDTLETAVGGRDWLIKSGKTLAPFTESTPDYHPRTAVGWDKEDNLFLTVVDGRNPGLSEGLHLEGMAQLMLRLGCVEALNLDGGGSSTFLLREAGKREIELKNHPSDGYERICADGLAVCSKAVGDGICVKASICPSQCVVVPGARMNFTAQGLDKAMNACKLPENVTYQLLRGCGTLKENGEYTAPEGESTEEIILKCGERILGTAEIEVRIPDGFEKTQKKVLPPESKSLISLHPLYRQRKMLDSPECYCYETSIGKMDENGTLFTGKMGETGKIRAYVKNHPEIYGGQEVITGYLPQVLDTFEGTLPEILNGTAEKGVSDRFSPRLGENFLRIVPEKGGCEVHGEYSVPAMPEKIGMWVRKKNLRAWLIGDKEKTEFVPGVPSDSVWTYYEAEARNILETNGKISLGIRFETDETFEFDSLRAVFNICEDRNRLPRVTRTKIIRKDEGCVIKITVYMGEDDLPVYSAPIDYKKLRIFLDGEELTGLSGHYGVNKGGGNAMLHSLPVTPGRHELRFCARDLYDNQNWYEETFDTDLLEYVP